MENIYTGKTLEVALEVAEKELGVKKEYFTYEILEYATKGLFKIGLRFFLLIPLDPPLAGITTKYLILVPLLFLIDFFMRHRNSNTIFNSENHIAFLYC